MTILEQKNGIYLGDRGQLFKDFISKLLKLGKLKNSYIKLLTEDESMKMYGSAFTSELVDHENNYQVFEQMGDLSGNKIIVSYMYKRFPQLNCSEGVKVVARLRINYGAKQCFAEIARKLGFWNFISATNELRQRKMKPLLEDVFEAFLGATEFILDNIKRVGVGYAIVYDIVSSIFDDMDISLKYEDLYDAKTRLKELFDMYETSIGSLLYKEQKQDQLTTSFVFRVVSEKNKQDSQIKIGEGTASLKVDAQQHAAAMALDVLAKQGWSKPVPKIYQKFCKDESKISSSEKIDEKKLRELWDDINDLYLTKEKSKYQNKYEGTPISFYTRKRNLSGVAACLNQRADPNIPDTDYLYPTDLLFIGKTDVKTVKNIISVMLEKYKNKLKITLQVFKMYYNVYKNEDPFFNNIADRLDIVEPEYTVFKPENQNKNDDNLDE